MYDESDDDMTNQKYALLLPIQQYCSLSDKVTCLEATYRPGFCEKRWNELFGACNVPNGGSFDGVIKDTCKLSCRNIYCKWLKSVDIFVYKTYNNFFGILNLIIFDVYIYIYISYLFSYIILVLYANT